MATKPSATQDGNMPHHSILFSIAGPHFWMTTLNNKLAGQADGGHAGVICWNSTGAPHQTGALAHAASFHLPVFDGVAQISSGNLWGPARH